MIIIDVDRNTDIFEVKKNRRRVKLEKPENPTPINLTKNYVENE